MSRQAPTLRECLRHPAVLGLVILSFLLILCVAVVSLVGYLMTSAALRQAESERKQLEDQYRQAQQAVDKFVRKVEDGGGKEDVERKKEE